MQMEKAHRSIMLKIGDLVIAGDYIGVFRIERLSTDGVTADIQLYDSTAAATTGKRISVPISILLPFQ
jgi:hypothetical protein